MTCTLYQGMIIYFFSVTKDTLPVSVVPDGYVQVGKIVYNPKEVLGHGCEGTFVYK